MNFFSLFKRKIIYNLKKKYPVDQDYFQSADLDFLFNHYGSDKAHIFSKTNNTGHGFSNFYEKQLKNWKDKEIKILEIGSFAGASAAAFVKYFNKSKVFCFDVNISNFKYHSKNIEVFGVDINNAKKIKDILIKIFNNYKFENFDLIIDDGSHQLSDILYSLKFFFKYLKKDGIFVIEDYKHPNYYKYNNDIDHILVDELLKNLKEKRNFKSSLFTNDDQLYFFGKISKIETYEGNLNDSNICFIKKS